MLQFKKEKQNRPPLIIHCAKGSLLPTETLDWFRFHFPQASTFDGYFQICYRGRKGFRTLWTGAQDNLEEFLGKMKIFSKSDYYISANCTTTVKRQKTALFATQNLVIDIDCHHDLIENQEKETLLEEFLIRFHEFPDLIPPPHSIVWTGRGLQLWWAIDPIHGKCLPFYNNVKKYFLHVIQYILEEYKLDLLTLDKSASLNPVGVFRLPGTNNPTARRKVRLERTAVKKPYVLQDLEKIMEANKQDFAFVPSPTFTEKNSKQENKRLRNCLTEKDPFLSHYEDQDISLLSQLNSFTYFRTKQLIQLRYLRNSPKSLEQRNNFSLLMYSALRSSLPHAQAWERLLIFNQGFKEPLTNSALENVISTAKYKDGYKFSNEKVVDFLQITPEEQDKIGLYRKQDGVAFDSSLSHMNQKHYNKLKRDYFQEKVISLFEAGLSCQDIGQTLNRTASTISRTLKPYRDSKKQGIYQEISTLLKQGQKFAQIAREHPVLKNLSSGSQQRYKVKAEAI